MLQDIKKADLHWDLCNKNDKPTLELNFQIVNVTKLVKQKAYKLADLKFLRLYALKEILSFFLRSGKFMNFSVIKLFRVGSVVSRAADPGIWLPLAQSPGCPAPLPALFIGDPFTSSKRVIAETQS